MTHRYFLLRLHFGRRCCIEPSILFMGWKDFAVWRIQVLRGLVLHCLYGFFSLNRFRG
jgi:hypothetical protein